MFSRADRFILVLCLTAIISTYYVCDRIYEQIPHTEDEISYRWQARVFAEGKYFVPSPPHADNLFVPFVIDYQGKRFSKYPPGWPLVLSLGMRTGLDAWVNPFLAGLCVWLAYLLGKRLMSETAGLLAAALMVSSPFFLLNSGSFLSSNLSLTLTGVFAFAWLKSFTQPVSRHPMWYAILAGTSLGWLTLTRPLTAVGVALPFGIHGMLLLWRGDWHTRSRVLLIGALTGTFVFLLPIWQYLLTGHPFLDPYTLWWKFDSVGFGKGHGIFSQGYTWQDAQENMKVMLKAARRDVFGWGNYSWILLPFGLWAFRKNRTFWPVIAIFFSLVLSYTLYWGHVTRYGPRYYYEGLFSLTILSAAGILWLAGKNKFRIGFAALLLGGLVAYNLFVYLPARLDSARAVYGITRVQLAPFQTQDAQRLTPALVFVPLSKKTVYRNLYGDWPQYGGLLELENPDLTSPFIFAVLRGEAENEALIQDFPGRRVIYYDPGELGKFHEGPRN